MLRVLLRCRLPLTQSKFRTLTARPPSRGFSASQTSMSGPFEKMAEEGIPKNAEPTNVAAPKMEQQDLPKLSAQDFRVYNRMAEHMDMFVSPYFRSDPNRCSCS